MPEYISREAAKDEMCERCSNVLMCTRSDNDCPIKRGLNSIPAADVVEVRHGHFGKHTSPFTAPCSECGTSMNTNWNHCPSCGAKMDGGHNDA